MAKSRERPRLAMLPIGFVLTAGALLTAFPFFWMLASSVKPLSESYTYPPHVLPSKFTFASYFTLFRDLEFGTYLFNTVIVVLISFVGMFFMAMAGYAFAKFRFRGRRALFLLVLSTSKPILAVVGVLTFISGWNSFLWPLIIANDQKHYTLSVGLSLLNKQLVLNPPLQMAGASLMVIPVVVVFVVLQRHI